MSDVRYELSISASAEVVKGPVSRVREFVENWEKVYPHQVSVYGLGSRWGDSELLIKDLRELLDMLDAKSAHDMGDDQ